MATSRPPKQDKDRQRGINIYDRIERDIKIHKALARFCFVVAVVFAIIQWVVGHFYGGEPWSLVPTIGIVYGAWGFVHEMQLIGKLRAERNSETLVQRILQAGDRKP